MNFSSGQVNKILEEVLKNAKEILYFMDAIRKNKDFQIPEKKRLVHKKYLPTLALTIKKDTDSVIDCFNWLKQYSEALEETTKISNQLLLD